MSIRVGRRIYEGKTFVDPSFEGYKKIICMTPSTTYGSLSPYSLVDDDGQIMENIWQFSKVFESVPYTKHFYSGYDKTVIWEHPAEKHVIDGKITNEYLEWRKKGFANKYAIRYPVPFAYRHKCIGAIKDINDIKDIDNINDINDINDPVLLDYISARKKIYVPLYCELVRKNKDKFVKLKKMLEKGEKLLIIEVDGPHQESMDYYKEKYNVDDKFIEDNTVIASKENLEILLNDPKHPFGHAYALSISLLDLDEILVN